VLSEKLEKCQRLQPPIYEGEGERNRKVFIREEKKGHARMTSSRRPERIRGDQIEVISQLMQKKQDETIPGFCTEKGGEWWSEAK